MCIQWLALPHRIGFIQAPAIDINLAVFQVDGLTGRRDDTFDKDVNSVPRPRILEYDDVAWLQITSRLKGNLLRKYAVTHLNRRFHRSRRYDKRLDYKRPQEKDRRHDSDDERYEFQNIFQD